jgi:hypothetical protein
VPTESTRIAGGGLRYGYRVVKTMHGAQLSTGEREIEPGEAAIVERVFREFVAGRSPSPIEHTLNRNAEPAARAGSWEPV